MESGESEMKAEPWLRLLIALLVIGAIIWIILLIF
jgi:hypothetical protein